MKSAEPVTTVDVEVLDDRASIVVVGELDLESAPNVDEAVQTAAAGSRHLAFDLDGVTFVDSAGLASVVRASRRFESIRISRASRQVRRLLEFSNLTGILPIES